MSRFFWVGNRAAVDFINTDVVAEGEPLELLRDEGEVLAWLREAGLPGGERTAKSLPAGLLREARSYRMQLREGIGELAAGHRLPASLLERTNLYLCARVPPTLTLDGTGYRLAPEQRLVKVADFMAPIADSFAEMVANDDMSRLRKCRNPECVLYFYDTSKGGQRAWCSLEHCGNKMRMAAMRERRASRFEH